MADGPDGRHVGKCCKRYNTPTDGPIGTKLGWSHPTNASAAKPFSSVLVVTAKRTSSERSGFMGRRDKTSTILMKLG